MKAKKKPVKQMTSGDVPGWPDSVTKVGGAVMDRLEPPPARPPGKILEGEIEQVVPELARLLREEAKVI